MWRRCLDCLGVTVEIACRVEELEPVLEAVFRNYARAPGRPDVEYLLEGAPWPTLVRSGTPIRRCAHIIDLVAVLERDLYREVTARAAGFILHAGAVVGAGGEALVFAGRSGAGKSTLVRALLSRGFRYLSEECVALAADGSCVGLARSLHTGDDASDLPPGFTRAEYPIRREGGQLQTFGLLHPPESMMWRNRASTAAVVAIDHAPGAASSLVPVSGGTALALLWSAVLRPDHAAVTDAAAVLTASRRFHLHTASPEAAIEKVLELAARLGVHAE